MKINDRIEYIFPCRTDRHHDRPTARRRPRLCRQALRPGRRARRQGCHPTELCQGHRQYPSLPGRRPGRAAGRCRRQPVERFLRLQLRESRSRPDLQPDAGEHRTAAEVPDLSDDRQQDRPLHHRLSDRPRPGPRERLRQSAGESGDRLGQDATDPKTNAEQFPEVKKLVDLGLQSVQYTFGADDQNQAAKLFRGASPSKDGTELSVGVVPDGVPMTVAPERREEFAPGVDADLLALIQATAKIEIAAAKG